MKKCKQGYYYCYTDEVCKPIPKGYRVASRFSGGGKETQKINGLMILPIVMGMEMVVWRW